MTELESEIQSMVRLVLQRLPHISHGRQVVGERTEAGDGPLASRIDARLITLETLKDLKPVHDTFAIDRCAVVTPAAFDYARARGWKIVRTFKTSGAPNSLSHQISEPSAAPAPLSPSKSVSLTILGKSLDVRYVRARFCPKQVRVVEFEGDDAAKLREIQSVLSISTNRAVIVADHPYSTGWQAGRHEEVRALVVSDPIALEQMVREVPANLLIVQSGKWNAGALTGLIRSWLKLTRER